MAHPADTSIPILRRADASLQSLPNTFENACECLKNAYKRQLEERISDSILAPYGIDLKEFMDKGASRFTPDVFNLICEQVRNQSLGCELFSHGFDASGSPHIFTVASPGVLDVYATHPVSFRVKVPRGARLDALNRCYAPL